MTLIPTVTVDEAAKASHINKIATQLNMANKRQIFSAGSYTWAVPAGVSTFRVYLVGGGGYSTYTTEFWAGAKGGTAPLVSKTFVDQEEGTSFTVAVGQRSTYIDNGGLPPTVTPATGSIFGASALVSNPGGNAEFSTPGSNGSQVGAELIHANGLFIYDLSITQGYGEGGPGGGSYGAPILGAPGLCVIEW